MDKTQKKQKRKLRLNLFDVVFIAVVLVAAWFAINYLGRSGGTAAIIMPGNQETVVYTIELAEMYGESAFLIKPGDALVDNIEKRQMGTVVSVEVNPATRLEKNDLTGDRVISEYPGRYNALVTVSADASVTENQITIPGGFVVRVGVRVSVNGPLYNSSGYIIDLERGDDA